MKLLRLRSFITAAKKKLRQPPIYKLHLLIYNGQKRFWKEIQSDGYNV